MTMWMHEVTAAWRMAQLTDSPAWVAWYRRPATLPLFVLGLASGALADLLNRRRFLAVAQAWIAVVAAVLAVLAGIDALTPGTLLLLCLLNGVGLALRFPVFSALVPDLVERRLLASALDPQRPGHQPEGAGPYRRGHRVPPGRERRWCSHSTPCCPYWPAY